LVDVYFYVNTNTVETAYYNRG